MAFNQNWMPSYLSGHCSFKEFYEPIRLGLTLNKNENILGTLIEVPKMSADSKTTEKFIIMPYRKAKGKLSAAEMRPASSEAGAIKIATSMAERYVGVAAYAVQVNEENGEMNAPRLLAQFGEIPSPTED